jgi:type I restriction enzyme, S subunit
MTTPLQSWSREVLKRRVRFAYGESLAAENRNDGDVPVFGSNGVIGVHDRSITSAPTIIIGRKGSSGRVTWSDVPCFPIDTTYFVDRSQTRENIRWLFYALEDLHLNEINFDSAVPGLSRELAYSQPMVFPTIIEQKRIASYLDASCAAIDAAVATKQNQIETLNYIQESITQHVVTCGLEEYPHLRQTGSVWIENIPARWDLVYLKRVSTVQTGLTLGKVYDGPLIERPYLRVANVQDGHLNLERVTMIEVPLEVARRVELQKNDVLLTEGGDLDKLGRGYLWNGEIEGCLHQNHIFAVRCFPHKLFPKFLTYLTTSRYGREYFEATGKRTTNLASTNSTKVGTFPIPLPPLSEQERLVEFLDERLAQLASLKGVLFNQTSTLLAYRKSLIHECVTGQRRVTEADVARVMQGKHEIKELA